MAISIAMLRSLVAAGVSASAIVDAIEAAQIEEDYTRAGARAEKRRKDRERQSKSRLSRLSLVTTVTTRDGNAAAAQIVEPAPASAPVIVVDLISASKEEFERSPQKENPPHPLKKNTSSSLPSLFGSEEERSGSTRAREADRAFDEQFWPPYPHKVGRARARKAFHAALRRVELAALLAGWQRYIAKTDDRPWCNPATWLNEDRWLDEPAMQSVRGPPSQRGNGGGFAGVMVDRYRESHDGGIGNHDGTNGFAATD